MKVFGEHNRRVLVVAGSRLAAEALMFALDSDPTIDAIGYGVGVWDAFELVSTYEPDVVVVGPGNNGLDQLHFTRLLGDFFPEIVQIAICSGEKQLLAARDAGVTTSLLDSCSADELLHTITSRRPSRRARAGSGRGSHLCVVQAGHAHA
jgi:DNA-binding NarL/FixJ family response regulator